MAAKDTVFLPRKLTEEEKSGGYFSKWLKCPNCTKDLLTVDETFQCDVCEVMQYCSTECRDDPVAKQHKCIPVLEKMRGLCRDFIGDYREAHTMMRRVLKKPRADGTSPIPAESLRPAIDAAFDASGEFMQNSLIYAPPDPLVFEHPVVQKELVPAAEDALAKFLSRVSHLERIVSIDETPATRANNEPDYNLPLDERVSVEFAKTFPDMLTGITLLVNRAIVDLCPNDPKRQREGFIEMNVFMERVAVVMDMVRDASEFEDPETLMERLVNAEPRLFDMQITDHDELVQLFFEETSSDNDEFFDTPEATFGVSKRRQSVGSRDRVAICGNFGQTIEFLAKQSKGYFVTVLGQLLVAFVAMVMTANKECVSLQSTMVSNANDMLDSYVTQSRMDKKPLPLRFTRIAEGAYPEVETFKNPGDEDFHHYAFMNVGITDDSRLYNKADKYTKGDGYASYEGVVHKNTNQGVYETTDTIAKGKFMSMVNMATTMFVLRVDGGNEFEPNFWAMDDAFDRLVLLMTIRSFQTNLKVFACWAMKVRYWEDDSSDPELLHTAIRNLTELDNRSPYGPLLLPQPVQYMQTFQEEVLRMYRAYEENEGYREILYRTATGHPRHAKIYKNTAIIDAINEEKRKLVEAGDTVTKLATMPNLNITTSTYTQMLAIGSWLYKATFPNATYEEKRDNPANQARERATWIEMGVAPLGALYLIGRGVFGGGRLNTFYIICQGIVAPLAMTSSVYNAWQFVNNGLLLAHVRTALDKGEGLAAAWKLGQVGIGVVRVFGPLAVYWAVKYVYGKVMKWTAPTATDEQKDLDESKERRIRNFIGVPGQWLRHLIRCFCYGGRKATRDMDLRVASTLKRGASACAYWGLRVVLTNYVVGNDLLSLDNGYFLGEVMAILSGDYPALFTHQFLHFMNSDVTRFFSPAAFELYPSVEAFIKNATGFGANQTRRRPLLSIDSKKPPLLLTAPPPEAEPAVDEEEEEEEEMDESIDIPLMTRQAAVSNAAFEKIFGDFCAQQHAKNPAEWTTSANDMRLIFDEIRLACGDLVDNMATYAETGDPDLLIKDDSGASPVPPAFLRLTKAIASFGRVISAPIDGVRHYKTDADTPETAVPEPCYEQMATREYDRMEHALTLAILEEEEEEEEEEPAEEEITFGGKRTRLKALKEAKAVRVREAADVKRAATEARSLMSVFSKGSLWMGATAMSLLARVTSASPQVTQALHHNATRGLYVLVDVARQANDTVVITYAKELAAVATQSLPANRNAFISQAMLFLKHIRIFARDVTEVNVLPYVNGTFTDQQRTDVAKAIVRAVVEGSEGDVSFLKPILAWMTPSALYQLLVNSVMQITYSTLKNTTLIGDYPIGQVVAITPELNTTLGIIAEKLVNVTETIVNNTATPIVEKVVKKAATSAGRGLLGLLSDATTASLRVLQDVQTAQSATAIIDLLIKGFSPADADTTVAILAIVMSAYNMSHYMLYSDATRRSYFVNDTNHEEGFSWKKLSKEVLPYAGPILLNLLYRSWSGTEWMKLDGSTWLSNKATYMLASQGILGLATQLAAWQTTNQHTSYGADVTSHEGPMAYLTQILGFTKAASPFLVAMQLRGQSEVDLNAWALGTTATMSALATALFSTGVATGLHKLYPDRVLTIQPNRPIRSWGDVPKKLAGNFLFILPALVLSITDNSSTSYRQVLTAMASTSFIDDDTPRVGQLSRMAKISQWLGIAVGFTLDAHADISVRKRPNLLRADQHSTLLVEVARRYLRDKLLGKPLPPDVTDLLPPPFFVSPSGLSFPDRFPDLAITDPIAPMSPAGSQVGPLRLPLGPMSSPLDRPGPSVPGICCLQPMTPAEPIGLKHLVPLFMCPADTGLLDELNNMHGSEFTKESFKNIANSLCRLQRIVNVSASYVPSPPVNVPITVRPSADVIAKQATFELQTVGGFFLGVVVFILSNGLVTL